MVDGVGSRCVVGCRLMPQKGRSVGSAGCPTQARDGPSNAA
jgi:hypothetical protein